MYQIKHDLTTLFKNPLSLYGHNTFNQVFESSFENFIQMFLLKKICTLINFKNCKFWEQMNALKKYTMR